MNRFPCRLLSNLIVAVGYLATVNVHAQEQNFDVLTISIPEQANVTLTFAAQELSKYFKAMTGRDYSVISEGKGSNAPLVCLKVDPSLSHDGYLIEQDGQSIDISGGSPRSCLYGAYTFLTELGCCWPLPGKEYEVIPRLEKISWSGPTIQSEPAITGRGITFFPGNVIDDIIPLTDWMAKNRFNFIFLCGRPIPTILPRLKEALDCRDMGLEWGDHLLASYLPRELFKEHPEYFRMKDGKRTEKYNMCPSSVEGADIIAKNCLKNWEYLQGFPRLELLHFWPDDLESSAWCSCEKCKGLTDSDQSLKMTNELARRLPLGDTALAHLSYHATVRPPKNIKPDKNVRLFYAPRERCYKHAMGECAVNREYLEYLKGQIDMFPNSPEVFEYYHDSYLFRTLPMPLHPVIGRDIAVYRQAGVKRISSLAFVKFSNWAYGPNYYVLGKSLWRGEGDQRDMQEYCDAVYGPQSKAMKQYFDMIFEFCGTVMEVCGYKMGVNMRHLPPYDHPFIKTQAARMAGLVTDENIEKIDGLLAGALAAAQEPYRGRIEEQRLLWNFARIDVPNIYRFLLASYLTHDLDANSTDIDRQYIIAIFKKALQDNDKATEILLSTPESLRGETANHVTGTIAERYNSSIERPRALMQKLEKQLSAKQPAAQPQNQP